MNKVKTVADVIAYVNAHPGSTPADLQAVNGRTKEWLAQVFSYEMKRTVPRLKRVPAHADGGQRTYRYYPADYAMPQQVIAPVEPPSAVVVTTTQEGEAVAVTRQNEEGQVQSVIWEKSAAPGIEELVDQIARSLASSIINRTHLHLAKAMAELTPAVQPLPEKFSLEGLLKEAEPEPKKPRVLIAGLIPSQEELIKAEYGTVFRLKFFRSDENLQKLKSMLPFTDHFITFTSKISHAIEDHAKASGLPILRCSGGMSMLRNMLTELYVHADDEKQNT